MSEPTETGTEKLDLTPRQACLLAAIEVFVSTKGYSPTVREVAELEGLSTMTAHRTLVQLRDLGLITWVEGDRRTMRRVYP